MSVFSIKIITAKEGLGRRWKDLFKTQGLSSEVFPAFGELKDKSSKHDFSIVILDDRTFPRGGREQDVYNEIRLFLATHNKSSILITGNQGSLSNQQIAGFLEAGADDFIPEDIDDRILTAKLKAHLRRMLPSLARAMEKLESPRGSIHVDRASRIVQAKTPSGGWGEIENLTPKEFEVLCLLLESRGSAVERRQMLERIWLDKSARVNVETVDKHVESLRRKLGVHGKKIRTVYGVGYSLNEG